MSKLFKKMNHFHKKNCAFSFECEICLKKQTKIAHNDKNVYNTFKIKIKKDSLVIFFLNLAAGFEMSYLKMHQKMLKKMGIVLNHQREKEEILLFSFQQNVTDGR